MPRSSTPATWKMRAPRINRRATGCPRRPCRRAPASGSGQYRCPAARSPGSPAPPRRRAALPPLLEAWRRPDSRRRSRAHPAPPGPPTAHPPGGRSRHRRARARARSPRLRTRHTRGPAAIVEIALRSLRRTDRLRARIDGVGEIFVGHDPEHAERAQRLPPARAERLARAGLLLGIVVHARLALVVDDHDRLRPDL